MNAEGADTLMHWTLALTNLIDALLIVSTARRRVTARNAMRLHASVAVCWTLLLVGVVGWREAALYASTALGAPTALVVLEYVALSCGATRLIVALEEDLAQAMADERALRKTQ